MKMYNYINFQMTKWENVCVKWKSKIPRKNWNVTENSRVCDKQFLSTRLYNGTNRSANAEDKKKKEKHWYIDG